MKPNRKRKKPDSSSKLELKEIIGLTAKNANGVASSLLSSNCVYIAGCVVVVYNVNLSAQSHLMISHRMPKTLSCVSVSPDGRFIAAGESGHQPAVLIWDSSNLAFLSELKCHQYGTVCLAFSPDGKYLVSVGFPHDGYICIWDWQNDLLITKVKSSSSCSAEASVCFSSDGKFIITSGGKNRLKFWSIGSSMKLRSTNGTGSESLTMNGKTVNVGHQNGNSIVSVVSPIWTDGSLILNGNKHAGELPIYALTDTGILCVIDSGLSVQKWVDLKVGKGFALSASNKLIACACSNGIVQLLTLVNLNHAGSLLYSEAKQRRGLENTDKDFPLVSSLPDAIACNFSTSEKLVVVYGDHTLYIWDVHDVCKATRCCVLVSHAACIWDVKNLYCESMHDPSLACAARGCCGGVSFATCSSDGTIMLWDFASQSDISEDISTNLATDSINTTHLVSAGILEQDTVEPGVGTEGFRSIAVSSDGKYLAAGDCQGNLHIYNLHTSDYTCIQGAHDSEILSLSFSLPNKKDGSFENITKSHHFLASGGRDRTIHIYDVERNFNLIESIDDHSAAVTCVNFTCNGSKILSCSADRSLTFRDVVVTDTGCKVLRRHHQMASHGTVYDMVVDTAMEVVITVGQDKQINTFNIAAGKLIKSFKQNGTYGEPIKITMDPSCSYLLCSYSNKSICIYDFITGEMVTQAMGHAEVITSLVFLSDCKHVISVGGDGCIFLWKLPAQVSSRMLQKLENSGPLLLSNTVQPVAICQFIIQDVDDHKNIINPENNNSRKYLKNANESVHHQRTSSQTASAFRFSISKLPKWAQEKVTDYECTSLTQKELNNPCSFVANGEGHDIPIPEVLTPSRLGDGENAEHNNSIHDTSFPEVLTPSELDVGDKEKHNNSMTRTTSSSDTDQSRSSSMPKKHLGFAMGSRWNTIHTVCMDQFDSPYLSERTKEKTSVPFSNSLHRLPMNKERTENSLSDHEVNACHDVAVRGICEQFESKSTTKSDVQAILTSQSEDNGLFNRNFENLSTSLNVESRKSLVRRQYSSRFTVRRDHIKGCNTLFNTAIREVGGTESSNCRDVISEDQSILKLEEQQKLDSCEQDTANECKEVLLSLDAVADKAMLLFSKLRALTSIAENSNGLESLVSVEAAEILPSVIEKIHAVSNILQCTKAKSCSESSANGSSIDEPSLLGAFGCRETK